jgi:exoribonuclease R
MLTPELVKIASLNPNVERLAFSVYVRMNLEGDIVGESRVEKNVIKSRFKLSYETVQDVITAKINFDDFLKKHPETKV